MKQEKRAKYAEGKSKPEQTYQKPSYTIDPKSAIEGVAGLGALIPGPWGYVGKGAGAALKLKTVEVNGTTNIPDDNVMDDGWTNTWNTAKRKQSQLTSNSEGGLLYENTTPPRTKKAYYFFPKELGNTRWNDEDSHPPAGVYYAVSYNVVYYDQQKYHADHYGVNGYINSGTVITLETPTRTEVEYFFADAAGNRSGVKVAAN